MKTKPVQPKRKALIRVLGCKVNQAEAAAMADILERNGYEIDSAATEPDLVLVNTCCVTQRAEGKSRRMVGKLAQKYPRARLVVTGCLAEVNPASVQATSPGAGLLGTFEKDHFDELIRSSDELTTDEPRPTAAFCKSFADLGAHGLPDRTRGFLKIQDGCSQRCTYCIVPSARGPSRSLDPRKVLEHARQMEAAGFPEIVLSGIHLGHYGRDLSPARTLERLLEQLLEHCPLTRFRLSSLEPQEITPRLIHLMTKHPGVCRHFHIPLQSGDNGILKKMGRPYTAKLIQRLADRILFSSPEACIGLDVMVGFPGEDEASFRRTVDLIREMAPAYLHVFPFSPRPGTLAATFNGRVPDKTARKRVEELRDLSSELRTRFYARFLGRTFPAVLEERSAKPGKLMIARTDNYIPVKLDATGSLVQGRPFNVTLERIAGDEVFGSTTLSFVLASSGSIPEL